MCSSDLAAHPEITYVCGGNHNWEFNRAGVDKGSGLSRLMELMNVPLSTSMACGDSENDLALFRTAGVSVAMANAPEGVKRAADFITRSNQEGGVALARNEDLLRGASSTGEGARLAKAVASRLLREGELVELAAFGIDCCARLLGDRAGRKSAKPHQGGRSCAKRAPIDSAARQLESEGESL